MNGTSLVVLGVLSLAALGCHHDKATTQTTPVAATPPASADATPVAQAQVPASPSVGVSDDLARQCSLAVGSVERAPKFALDDAQLMAEDRDVLEKIATCVTTGPLAGKTLQLFGRADPRGTEEYNLGLGSRRAGMVGEYLQHLGVQPAQLASTTRGALDAAGTDEGGWKSDRRVDVRLL